MMKRGIINEGKQKGGDQKSGKNNGDYVWLFADQMIPFFGKRDRKFGADLIKIYCQGSQNTRQRAKRYCG